MLADPTRWVNMAYKLVAEYGDWKCNLRSVVPEHLHTILNSEMAE